MKLTEEVEKEIAKSPQVLREFVAHQTEIIERAWPIIASAIHAGMPLTKEVAAVRNAMGGHGFIHSPPGQEAEHEALIRGCDLCDRCDGDGVIGAFDNEECPDCLGTGEDY